MTIKHSAEDIERSKDYLADRLDAPRVNLLFANIRHVSPSGMTRKISFYVIDGGELLNVTSHVARVLGYSVKNYHGYNTISVGGVGMDMAFKITYDLSSAIFGDGYHVSSRTI